MPQFGYLERRLNVGDESVLPHAVGRFRQAALRGVGGAGVEPEEVVGQEDGLRVAHVGAAHHHLQVHAGAVLADPPRGAQHLHVQHRMPLLEADQRGRYEFGAETVRGADAHHAGQGVPVLACGSSQ